MQPPGNHNLRNHPRKEDTFMTLLWHFYDTFWRVYYRFMIWNWQWVYRAPHRRPCLSAAAAARTDTKWYTNGHKVIYMPRDWQISSRTQYSSPAAAARAHPGRPRRIPTTYLQNSSFEFKNSSFLIHNSSFLIQNSSFLIHDSPLPSSRFEPSLSVSWLGCVRQNRSESVRIDQNQSK